MERHPANPLIVPSMLKPTLPELEVMGAFNAGATTVGDETILLLRVAERCRSEEGHAAIPVYSFADGQGQPEIVKFRTDDPDVELLDTRGVVHQGKTFLSTLSTIRVARSRNGVEFAVDEKPLIYPCVPSEQYGCEDPRVQMIDGTYYINYTAVSRDGWATALCTSRDFVSVDRKGIIFPPQNKDVCIFPEKVGGLYYALHRPNNDGFGRPSIWISSSPDLVNWGQHECILRPANMRAGQSKVGGGAPPIKTPRGWLELYHEKDDSSMYTLHTLLLDLDDPRKVLAKGSRPFLRPEQPYETEGFFPNVVFSNGWVVRDDGEVYIYYGASDETTNLAITTVDELLEDLTDTQVTRKRLIVGGG